MAALARAQHGVVARWQLLELGFSRRQITSGLQRGRLHEVFLGVYVLGARRISRKGRWMAAVLAAGGGALLSHRSAGRFWQLLPPAVEWIDVTAPLGRVVRRKGIVAHESSVPQDERTVVDGIPVTSVFRTVFDLAAVLDRRGVGAGLARGGSPGAAGPGLPADALGAVSGAQGCAEPAGALGGGRAGGVHAERLRKAFVAFVDEYRLRRPRMNGSLALRGRFFEIDALWEDERVAVELDSRSVHGTNKNFESDKQRDRILLAEGWRTVRVTWRQLKEEPDEVAADLRKALGHGAGVGDKALGQGRHPHPPGK